MVGQLSLAARTLLSLSVSFRGSSGTALHNLLRPTIVELTARSSSLDGLEAAAGTSAAFRGRPLGAAGPGPMPSPSQTETTQTETAAASGGTELPPPPPIPTVLEALCQLLLAAHTAAGCTQSAEPGGPLAAAEICKLLFEAWVAPKLLVLDQPLTSRLTTWMSCQSGVASLLLQMAEGLCQKRPHATTTLFGEAVPVSNKDPLHSLGVSYETLGQLLLLQVSRALQS
jgi:hypothetical protein